MENSPAWEMLFTGLLGVWFIGYVIFRIARGFYRWAMGRTTRRRENEWESDSFSTKMNEDTFISMDEATDPSFRFLPGNVFHGQFLEDTSSTIED